MRTCRRQFLDAFLVDAGRYCAGTVLDIGGKKVGKRGLFRPPEDCVKAWLYLNIDIRTGPDILARAEQIPLPDGSIDTFLMCEVLEHLLEPEKSLAEAARVLKPGGHGIITMPFLYPIHADPFDFQRWTDARVAISLQRVGLEQLEIRPMGGAMAVIADILQLRLSELPAAARLRRFAGFALLSLFKRVFLTSTETAHPKITTGFGIIVRKVGTSEEKI